MIPGEMLIKAGDIELNANRKTLTLTVSNTGDRPIQVGSHTHFFESNHALHFDRERAYGYHLDIPAGTALRFEPGESRDITLVTFGGNGVMYGMNALVSGSLSSQKKQALNAAKADKFGGLE